MFKKRIKDIEKITPDRKDWEKILNNNFTSYESYKSLLDNRGYENAAKKLKQLLPDYYFIFNLINNNNMGVKTQIIKNLLIDIKNFDLNSMQKYQDDVIFQFGEW